MRIITATYLIYLEGFINIVNFTFDEKISTMKVVEWKRQWFII